MCFVQVLRPRRTRPGFQAAALPHAPYFVSDTAGAVALAPGFREERDALLEADQLPITAGLAVAAHSEVRAETFNPHRQLLTNVATIMEMRLLSVNHLADDGQVDHGAFMPERGAIVGSHPGKVRLLGQALIMSACERSAAPAEKHEPKTTPVILAATDFRLDWAMMSRILAPPTRCPSPWPAT